MRIPATLLTLIIAVPAAAQDREVPYWATIKAETLNMRAGPGRDFPVRWVYRREGLPLKVVRVHEGWRLVRDPAGDEGWVTANLLSAERGALVTGEGVAPIRDKPDGDRAARKVSLRSPDGTVDVSVIARKMGGGGHRRAAGFSTDRSYDELVEILSDETRAGLA